MKRYFLLIFVFNILLSLNLNAQSEELIETIQPSDLVVGEVRSIQDPSFADPNSLVEKPAIEVSIGILDDVVINPSIWFTYDIELEIRTINLITQAVISESLEKFSIAYSPFGNVGNFKDLDLKKYNNAQRLEIKVKSITVINKTTEQVLNISNPGNVYLELKFTSNRYRRLSTVLPNITPKFYNYNENGDFEIPNSSSAKEVEFNWEPITGAKYYDLEWTWIDSYPNSVGDQYLEEGDLFLSIRDFENNSSRIQTEDTSYRLPLIYANGYLIYRIRAVGFRADDYSGNNNFTNTSKLFFGEWSSNPETNDPDEIPKVSAWNNVLQTHSHENNKNWQFQASFAENGKKKEVVSYFDGTLRNRQTVTKINTDNTAIVGEVIYDNQGRPAVEVLPAPAKISALKFHEKFNVNLNEIPTIYTHYDFDWSDPSALDCNLGITTGGMNDTSGASLYYSDKLDLKTEPKDYFIPFANYYPFSQIQYTDDNTGRIKRKSGVGEYHKLGSDHEMKYYYGTPNQPELNRLFGYKVGFNKFYKKNTVVDPNGQISVSYLDPQGRTIATALSGNSPENLTTLPDAISDPSQMSGIDLLSKLNPNDTDTEADKNLRFNTGTFDAFFDGLVYSGNHFALNNNDQFILSYKAKIIDVLICEQRYPFVYDLNLSILNECGDDVPTDLSEDANNPISILSTTIGNNTSYPGSDNPQVINYSKEITTTAGQLKQGNHVISKTISINEEAYDIYLEEYMLSECILPKSYFQLHLLDDSCDVTPDECVILRNTTAEDYALSEIAKIDQHLTDNYLPVLTNDEKIPYTNAFIDIYNNKIDTCDQIDDLVPVSDPGTYTFTADCDIANLRLLNDFRPNDQYAIYKDDGNELIEDRFSIYYGCNNVNDDTCTNPSINDAYLPSYSGNLELPIWKHPKDLQDSSSTYYTNSSFDEEATVDVKVEVDENGEFLTDNENNYIFSLEIDLEFIDIYFEGDLPRVDEENYLIDDNVDGGIKVRPHHLANELDFIAAWNDSWAHSLLYYHPEIGYTSYFDEICSNIGDTTNNPQQLSSSAFDDYIKSKDATTILTSSNLQQIFDEPLALLELDPFFNIKYENVESIVNGTVNIDSNNTGSVEIEITTDIVYDNNNELEARNALMKYALEHDIDGLGLPMWQHAYRLFKCGDIVLFDCNMPDTIDDLFDPEFLANDEDKEGYWRAYRTTYLSTKEKIIYLFSNIFARQNGFYNGCIENLSDDPFLVIENAYPNVLVSGIRNYYPNSNNAPGVCNNNAPYDTKLRRYLPLDVAFGENAGDEDVLSNLVDENDYAYWQFTGMCPDALDMNYFIKGVFSDINKNGSFPVIGSEYKNVQYLTQDLYTALGGTVIVGDNTGQPLLGSQGVKIYTNGTSASNTGDLAISVGDDFDTDDILDNDETCNILINDTNSDNVDYDWRNYGTDSTEWSIIDVRDIVYTGLDNQDRYTFTFLAIVSLEGNPNNTKEVIFSGASCANIGVCGSNPDEAGGDDYDFIPVPEECEIRHIGLSILAPDGGDNSSAVIAGAGTTRSPLNQGQRHDIAQGVVDFINIKSEDDFLLSTYHDASAGINHQPGLSEKRVGLDDGNQYELLDLTGGEFGRQPRCVAPQVPGYFFQIQNDNYKNTFKTVVDAVLPNINNPMDIMYFVIVADQMEDLNSVKSSYLNFKNNSKIKKVFFIILDNGQKTMANFDTEDQNEPETNWTPYQFIDFLIEGTPVEYNGTTNTTLNSDYTTFNLDNTLEGGINGGHGRYDSEPNIHDFPDLTTFLTNSYNEVFETSTGAINSNTCNPCTPLAPPTTSCDEAWDIYENGLGNDDGSGYSTLVSGLELANYAWLDRDEFCDLNYKYSIAHYEKYVTDVMNVLDTNNLGIDNAYYIEFTNFTSHSLGYGHPETETAIQEYASYLSGFSNYLANYTAILNGDTIPYPDDINNPENDVLVPLNFLNYVADKYIPISGVCARGMVQMNTPEIVVQNDCESFLTNIQNTYQSDLYEQYLEEQREYFRNEYLNAGMNSLVENLDLSYDDKEYQYTLYYYDQAGNLMQTVPPKGVDKLEDANELQIDLLRQEDGVSTDPNINPKHELRTRYKYNSLNQLVYQKTPDGGETRFAYDDLGRIVMSQNAKQAIPANGFFEEEIEHITFVNKIGVYTSGNNVFSAVSGEWVAGASSQELIYDNGYVEWELLAPNDKNAGIAVGLSYSDDDTTAEDIDFRFYQSPGAPQKLLVYNDLGGGAPSAGTWAVGQKLKIARIDGEIRFYKNGNPVHSMMDINPTLPLRFDCAFNGNEPMAVRNIKIVNTWKILESFSYTSYDALGRIVEAGQLKVPNDLYNINNEGRLVHTLSNLVVTQVNDELAFPSNISEVRQELTVTNYDYQSVTNIIPVFEDYNQFNNRNRVTAVLYFENYTNQLSNYNNGLFYSYDIHGNVKELVTDIKDPRLQLMWQNLKKVSYEYDLISGNVNKVTYQKGYKDQFIHQYFYDADNRITKVKTSKDGIIWENEAEYDYYKHGPLARVLIGDKKVQGTDYAYTIQGWLKGVNSEKIEAEDDIGNDGYYGGNFKVAKDAFGFSLRYYKNDYLSNEGIRLSNISNFMELSGKNLYNGNIKQMVTSLRGLQEEKLSSLSNLYRYDQLNRISSSYNQTIKEVNSNNSFDTNSAGYDTRYTYDKNGNISSLNRDAFGVEMDNFELYKLYDDTNQLKYIKEMADPNNFDSDIDQQPSENYIYDAIGQLITDNSESLKIAWTVSGKVKAIEGNKDIKFTYDGLGNRLSKTETKKEGNSFTTYYLRDAQGNTLAVNDLNSFPSNNFVNWNTTYAMKEHNIYGSSRLGLQKYSIKRKEDLLASLNYTNDELKKFRASQQQTLAQNNPSFCENCAYSFNDTEIIIGGGSIVDHLLDINLDTANTFTFNTTITPLNSFEANAEELIFYLGESTFGAPTEDTGQIFLYLIKSSSSGSDFKYLPVLKLVNNQLSSTITTTYEITNVNEVSISNIGDLQDIYYSVEVTPSNQYKINLNLNGSSFSSEEGELTISENVTNLFSIFGSRISRNNFKMCHLGYSFTGVNRSFDFSIREENPTSEYNGNIVELNLSNLNDSLWFEGGCGEDNDDDDDTVLNDQEGMDPDGINHQDTDQDGIPDFEDKDDDGDGIWTIYEDVDGNGSVLNDNTDGDLLLNYLDPDDDDDNILTKYEFSDPNEDHDPNDAVDSDLDGIKNYLDEDDDGDSVLTKDEFIEDFNENFDEDIYPNYLDTDDDNDTVPTAFENTFDANPDDGLDVYLLDTDGDGDYNFLDIDDDNDGYITKEEDDNFNNNPIDDDEDGDGHPDFLDSEDLNPNIPGNISTTSHYNLVGDKRYELSNHLGNVVSVISDRKLPASNIGKEWYGSKSFKNYWQEYGKSSISLDNNYTLHVKCHAPSSGAFGKYELNSNLTYSVQMDIGKENFMANLVFEILDPSENVIYSELITESTTIGTQFTAAQSGSYIFVVYVDESFTQVEEFTISNLIIADVSGVAQNTNQIDIFGTFIPDVFAYNDYYPFGMLMHKRHDTAGDYRYGFQGQEKDDEIKGEGNSLNYTFRMYDPRAGRFFAVDPLAHEYPWYTPYQFSGNRPIDMKELEGLEPIEAGKAEGERQYATTQGGGDDIDRGSNTGKNWIWHDGGLSVGENGDTSCAGWHTEESYANMIKPMAVQFAQTMGWQKGTTASEARELISNPGNPDLDSMSQQEADFFSSREFASGYETFLYQYGASTVNTHNKDLFFSATGQANPMGFDSPFFIFGGALKHLITPKNFVFRVVRPDESIKLGLFAKNPSATYTIEGHVLNGSKTNFKSQFISTTKDLKVAKIWANKTGNQIVKIDMKYIKGKVYDLSTKQGQQVHLRGTTATNFANKSKEVLIEGSVPAKGIKSVKN